MRFDRPWEVGPVVAMLPSNLGEIALAIFAYGAACLAVGLTLGFIAGAM